MWQAADAVYGLLRQMAKSSEACIDFCSAHLSWGGDDWEERMRDWRKYAIKSSGELANLAHVHSREWRGIWVFCQHLGSKVFEFEIRTMVTDNSNHFDDVGVLH
jgi:hypothetical protein